MQMKDCIKKHQQAHLTKLHKNPKISYSQFFAASISPGSILLQEWGLSAALHGGASLLVMSGNNAQIYVFFIAWGFIFLCLSYVRIPCNSENFVVHVFILLKCFFEFKYPCPVSSHRIVLCSLPSSRTGNK